MPDSLPVLYSFRRCPYAMRARLALRYSQIKIELREVDLKHKPDAMLQASAKGTVPVLVCPNGTVIEESIEIMYWALQQHDPEHWLKNTNQSEYNQLIIENDESFKVCLDHYKYADRFPEHQQIYYRQQGEKFLQQLETRLNKQTCLINDEPSIADIALLPFIRQFAYVDIQWFKQSPYVKLREWLFCELDSERFHSIMQKHPAWHVHQETLIF